MKLQVLRFNEGCGAALILISCDVKFFLLPAVYDFVKPAGVL